MQQQIKRPVPTILLVYLIIAASWTLFAAKVLRFCTGQAGATLMVNQLVDWGLLILSGVFLYYVLHRYWQGLDQKIAQQQEWEVNFRRTERALKTLSACNGALVRAKSEPMLLSEIARMIVEKGGYRMVWVGFAEEDETKSVRIGAHAGCEEGYLEKSGITWSDTNERGLGPIGVAIRTGQITGCNDFQTDPKVAPWRAEAIQRGYTSMIVLPLRNAERTFGALSFYSAETNAFNPAEVELLTELAEDLSYGIQALRARRAQEQTEEKLHASETFVRCVLDSITAHIAVLNEEGTIVAVNQAWRRFASENGADDQRVHLGVNYLAACQTGVTHNGKAIATKLGLTAPNEIKRIQPVIHATTRREGKGVSTRFLLQ